MNINNKYTYVQDTAYIAKTYLQFPVTKSSRNWSLAMPRKSKPIISLYISHNTMKLRWRKEIDFSQNNVTLVPNL
jgi:hypothetical protein